MGIPIYVVELEENIQNKIKKELLLYYKEELELSEAECIVELEIAVNSKITDLSDTINIQKIIN